MPSFKQLQQIRKSLEAGERRAARRLLKPLLNDHPTADVWYLAALACETDEQAIKALRKTLALEPLHPQANQMLLRLEGAKPGKAIPTGFLSTPVKPPSEAPPKKVSRQKQRSVWTKIGCAGSFLLSLTASYFVLSFFGSPLLGKVTGLFTGSGPVEEIDGTPVALRDDAPLVVTPQQSKQLEVSGTTSDTLSAGYLHEYTFQVHAGEEIALMVQFLSPTAGRVSRNVAVMSPDGTNAEPFCSRDSILQGDNGVVLDCQFNRTGIYRIHVFGRDGESTGAYVVSLERFH